MNHQQLIRLSHAFGYEKFITAEGLCHGFSTMWVQAVASNQLHEFNTRLNFLDKFANNPEALKKEVDEVRTYVKNNPSQPLSEEQKKLLEIPAFFEGVAAYLNPLVAAEAFEKNLQQTSTVPVSTYLQSKELEKKGGLVRAFHATNQYTLGKLTAHLNAVSQQLNGKTETAILFSANNHTVAARVVGENQFELIDTNYLSDYGKIFSSKQLAEKLNNDSFWNKMPWHSRFTGGKELVLTTDIFTNPSKKLLLEPLQVKNFSSSLTPDKAGRTLMHHAIIHNDIDALKKMDFTKIDVNQTDAGRLTPLEIACFHGSEEAVDFLLNNPEASAKLNANKFIAHPFLMAAQSQNFALIDKLSSHPRFGAALEASFDMPYFNLAVAGTNDSDAAVAFFNQLIATKKESINDVDKANFTALFHACTAGNETMVDLLLKNGADLNEGISPLIGAALSGKENLLKTLLDRGVNCNQVNFTKRSALHMAAFKGNVAMVDLLLERSADCNLRSTDGVTPLISACQGGHTNLIPKLLPKTDLSMNDIQENSLLSLFIRHKCEPDVQTMFLKKALETYINHRDKEADYHSRLKLGFSKDDKKEAAQALLDNLNGKRVSLREYHGALSNGRLFSLYDLYNGIEEKRQCSSSATMVDKMGKPVKSSMEITSPEKRQQEETLPTETNEEKPDLKRAPPPPTPLKSTPF